MRPISLQRFHTGLTLQTIKRMVQEGREAGLADAKQQWDFPVFKSRGTFLCTLDAGGQCHPAIEAQCPVWRGTEREIDDLLQRVLADHPNVTEIYISGGYDGAKSPRDFQAGEYEPFCGSWVVSIWKRADSQSLP